MRLYKLSIILSLIIVLGIITPFIPFFTIIEVFYLLLPFTLIFIGSSIYLIASLGDKEVNTKGAILKFLFLPIFILTQLLAVFVVDRIQRYKSEKLIAEVEYLKKESGKFPSKYSSPLGIKYESLELDKGFIVEYSRGFMVTKKYDSRINKWKSYGWND